MRHLKWYILLVLVLVSLVVWYAVARAQQGMLTVAFLDVGQGDAIFIESPAGNQMLIDGGPGKGVLRELGSIMPFYDRSIDVMIATHPDADHIGGLPDVLESYDVSLILEPGAVNDTGVFNDFVRLMNAEPGVQHILARRGEVIDLGGGAYARVLFPDRDVRGVESNAASVIVQVVYGDTEFLLTGDSPSSIERYLSTLDGQGLASDVLKAGHHGSNTSSADVFVAAASPTYAVLSRGCENRYGHPHAEVLETLNRFGIEILDTCERGTIVFESDGETTLEVR